MQQRRVLTEDSMRDALRLARECVNSSAVARTLGNPRLHTELCAKDGRCRRNGVVRLMKKYPMTTRPLRRFVVTTDSDQALRGAPNPGKRPFPADVSNQKGRADLTRLGRARAGSNRLSWSLSSPGACSAGRWATRWNAHGCLPPSTWPSRQENPLRGYYATAAGGTRRPVAITKRLSRKAQPQAA